MQNVFEEQYPYLICVHAQSDPSGHSTQLISKTNFDSQFLINLVEGRVTINKEELNQHN